LKVVLILIRSTLKVNQAVDLVDPGSETDGREVSECSY
jgi:hypothetical protein